MSLEMQDHTKTILNVRKYKNMRGMVFSYKWKVIFKHDTSSRNDK